MQEILRDEIDDPEFLEFAIENLDEILSYIINGNLSIRIHRDIAGEMWFVIYYKKTILFLSFILQDSQDIIAYLFFSYSCILWNMPDIKFALIYIEVAYIN